MKKWYIYNKKADFAAWAAKFGISPVTARVMRNRDICTEAEAEAFLSAGPEALASPLFLPDIIRCINQLHAKIEAGQRIRVVGDYDIDGVCASYILYAGLRRAGARADYVIPHRIRDGYGINRQIIEAAHAEGVDTLITCDNGISAVEALTAAQALGMTVLVTDHHDVPQQTLEDGRTADRLPPAAAVVNPKRQDSRYPYPGICGAVVAWKVIQLLYQRRNIAAEEAMDFLPFAAVATVGDVCKLQGENRIIVREGLRGMTACGNIGLRKLMEVCGLNAGKLSAYQIGFVLGPCINAGGRLESAVLAMQLFLCENEAEALCQAEQLKALNEARKDMTLTACEEAYAQVEAQLYQDRVLLVYLPQLHESLAGIVAGRVRERYYKPAFVVTRAEPEDGVAMAKGSGRSIEGYPMAAALAEQTALLSKFGGHPMAAGFSLREADVAALRRALNQACTLTQEQLQEKVWIDVAMPLSYISEALIADLQKLEPFGNGNEKPQFACKDLQVMQTQIFGARKNVVKLALLSPEGTRMNGVIFTDGAEFLEQAGGRKRMNVIYYPQLNEYNGNKTCQIVIKEFQWVE